MSAPRWVSRAVLVWTAGSALVGSLASCSGGSGPAQASSTRRMAERLEEIARTADPAKHLYVNDKRVAHFRAQLEQLRQGPGADTPQGKDRILRARLTVANELLRNGQTEAALAAIHALQEEVDNPQFEHVLQALLGLAYHRLAERDNCNEERILESCLMPVTGVGVHRNQRGARGAVENFEAVLGRNPGDLSARWMLNIAYMALGEYPDAVPSDYLIPPEIFDSDYDIKRFRNVAPRVGLDVEGLSGGGIMEDFDGDGYLDVMCSSWGLRDQIRYFRNRADGTFEERTEAAGLAGIVGGLNTRCTDYDNDGDADVLVLRGAWLNPIGNYPNSLLQNQGDGTFVDVTEQAGLLSFHPTQTASWGDYDNDGWLDLYVGNESVNTHHPCELFHNNGDGTFTDVAEETGLAVMGFVKAVQWGDYNNDGRQDLYMSRITTQEKNLLFRNDGPDASGRWRFTDVTAAARVPGPVYSFPLWFWDYNNDGWLDLFVAGFKAFTSDVASDYLGLPNDGQKPRLYRNNRDGTFADVTREARVDKVLLTMGSNFGDLDNDGYPDFYIGTGDPGLGTVMPNRMFRNAEGRFFQDVTTAGGFGNWQKGHGVAFGDIDHDGDQDVFADMGGAFAGDLARNVLFENPGHGNHWIKLKLEGTRCNRGAVGTRIKVTVNAAAGPRDIYATVASGGSFGTSSLRQEIGLGQATAIQAIEVFWPASGETQVFTDVAMDQMLLVREGDPKPTPLAHVPFDLSPGD